MVIDISLYKIKWLVILLLLLLSAFGCSGYETESTQAIKDATSQHTIIIRSCRWITMDANQHQDMLHIVSFVQMKSGEIKVTVTYSNQVIRAAFGRSVERFLPRRPINYVLPMHSPKWRPSDKICIPNSSDVEKIFFLIRDSKDLNDSKSWRWFDYKQQDWSKAVVIPKLEELPLCAEHPEYAPYPAMIDDADKLAEKLDVRAWYDNF